MVSRRIKEKQWDYVYNYITIGGRAAPHSLQYDVDVTCNGVGYIVRVQPGKQRQLVALQAMEVWPAARNGRPEYILIEDAAMLCALLEILIYQAVVNLPAPPQS